ncbi:MAG: PilZ domain-containing protein [Desulforegulaceae bacterium]|nr:PilZ domain-containing protein [Desulforegulaceae bacterium]
MAEEKRSYPRKPYFIPIDYIDRNRIYREYIVDINPSGVFIKTDNSVPVGNEISLTLPFPSQNQLTISGIVIRNTSQGIAVRFHKKDIDLISKIESLVEKIEAAAQNDEWG